MRAPRLGAWAVVAALLGAGAAAAEGTGKPGAPLRVHDHEAFTFLVADGPRTPAQRAAEASQNLSAVIDDQVAGPLEVEVNDSGALVRVGGRQLFGLTAADAQAAGEPSLGAYAPQVQAALDAFLQRERRRAEMQHFVLSFSAVVSLALLAYLLLRLLYRTSHAWEERLLGSDVDLARQLNRVGVGTERARALLVLAIGAGRILAVLATAYLLLVFGLSLFDATRAGSSLLATWAAAPFVALGHRLLHSVPNLLLLLVFWAILRGGWRAMTVGFERISSGRTEVKGIPPALVVPIRLVARAVLVLATLLLVPLLIGTDNPLPAQLGMILLGGLALSAVPLVAAALAGTYGLLTAEYRLGDWVEVRLRGDTLSGEVTRIDFFHLRLVPPEGGEVRVPHLLLLLAPLTRLPTKQALEVGFDVALEAMPPDRALEAVRAAADKVRVGAQLAGPAAVELRSVDHAHAHFTVTLPEAAAALRTELLLALHEATRPEATR